ncbi:OmpA family protein [Dyadobacter sandarakinus]|uniref:OmpA family protein n=1 Tax=Dyadobacter sandarakinus TaxID=2747268 RepID=A0ABX7I2X9_9BACT|nr:OmpA family protein [Dyadobacter sandarakinus]QRR00179.1 OmpA family protein [Dyadobacter sandarakinus]
MLAALFVSLLSLASDSIRITGNCYNVADQTRLSCSTTLVYGSTSQVISADRSGNFAFTIPDSTHHLTFQSAGFEERIISVNQVGSNRGNATFAIKVPMLKNGMDPAIKEDETMFPKSQLFIKVDAPDSLSMHMVLTDHSKRKIQENRPIISSPQNRILTINYILPGPYSLSVGLFDLNEKNRVNITSQESVVLNEGFNFLYVKYSNAKKSPDVVLLTPRTLYFDQSSYNLRKDSKLVLDSVCAVLVRRHSLIALVKGHTDNVGKANLNLILSEYRARVVQTYMNQHGVHPGQTKISWKGSGDPVAANDTEENKSRNRRVEIQLVQKQ